MSTRMRPRTHHRWFYALLGLAVMLLWLTTSISLDAFKTTIKAGTEPESISAATLTKPTGVSGGIGWGIPTDITESYYLFSVSCPSATECWGVGVNSNHNEGIATEWTPSTGWSAATDLSGSAILNNISCPSTTECWAVGEGSSTGGIAIEWTPSTGWGTPTDISGSLSLVAISCPSTTECWAVGANTNGIEGAATEWPSVIVLSLPTPPLNHRLQRQPPLPNYDNRARDGLIVNYILSNIWL
jgi:hypothetical protein